MPLKKKKNKSVIKSDLNHRAFFPILGVAFLIWLLYRVLFSFDVWFDEIIGKAIFFGMPVLLYVSGAQAKKVVDTFAPENLNKGLLLGIAIGGILGFVGSLLALIGTGNTVVAANLFAQQAFWWEFFLAMMTGFWETLFFFSWVMIVLLDKYRRWSMWQIVAMTTAIFVIFHIPNIFLRFTGVNMVIAQAILLGIFALGQSLLFYRWRNFYTLVLTQTIWGMVLLIHVQ